MGKIIDEVGLKRAMKANARVKKQCEINGVKPKSVYLENRAACSKKSQPTGEAKEMVKRNDKKGYG